MSATRTKYPEHEKLKARERDSRLLSQFYDFIVHDQCWFIAEYYEDSESDRLFPVRLRPDEIIGLFLDVDPKKLEAEKRAMLDEIRKAGKR